MLERGTQIQLWAGFVLLDAAFVCAELLCTARNGSVGAEPNSIIHANERLGGSLSSVRTR